MSTSMIWFMVAGALFMVSVHFMEKNENRGKDNPDEIEFAMVWRFLSVLGLLIGSYLYYKNPMPYFITTFITKTMVLTYHLFICLVLYIVGAYIMDKIIRFIFRK